MRFGDVYMKKYVCKRNEVMAGKLIMVLPVISDSEENNFNGYQSIDCRSMLYSVEDNKGKDLIYSIPNLYDLDATKVEKNNDMSYYITSQIELDELLKYLKFNKDLTQSDLNKIFNMLLKHKSWLKKHSELFGVIYDIFGNYIIDSKDAILTPDMYFRLKRFQNIGTKVHSNESPYQLVKRRK